MLTMGVYAEERKRGTMELLMTSPITELQIVLGKFLASLTLFAAMLLPTATYLIYMFLHSDPAPPWRMLLAGYLGVILFGGALIALGSFISSLTENSDRCGRNHLRRIPFPVDSGGDYALIWHRDWAGVAVPFGDRPLPGLHAGRDRYNRPDLLREFYFPFHFLNRASGGFNALAAGVALNSCVLACREDL